MLLSNRSGPDYGYRGPALTFDFGTRKLNNQSDVERYAKELVYWSVHRGSVYRGNRHLAIWGSDFQFSNAGMWFDQMDLLVKEINSNPEKYNATIQYSTLSTYFDHLHSLDEPLPVKVSRVLLFVCLFFVFIFSRSLTVALFTSTFLSISSIFSISTAWS
jgi:hypothetical protein